MESYNYVFNLKLNYKKKGCIKMKKLLSLVLCIALLCSCITLGVSASDIPTVNIYGVSNGSIVDYGDSIKIVVETSSNAQKITLYLDDVEQSSASENVYTISNLPNGRHILKAKANIDGNDYFSDVVVFYVATPRQTYAKSESDFESGLGNYTAGSGECVASPTESGKFSYKISNATSGMLLLYPEKHSTLHKAEQIWDFDMYVDDLADVSDLNMYFYSGAESTAKTNLLQPNADGKIVFKGPNGKEYPLSQEQWYHITVKYNNPQGRVEIFADVLGDGVPVSLGIHTYSSGPQNNTYAVRMQTSGTAYSIYFDNSRCIESHYSAFVKNISYYVGSTRYSEDNVPGNPDKIVLELNENKLPSTITNTAIYLKKGETIITPTITDASVENKYITMTFNPALESSTEYTIYVAQSVDTYKWAHSTTDQTYKFETAFNFDLYGISQYSRVNGDASTKLTAISGKKDDISLYVDGRRYAICEDTQEAIFELKDLTYGTHTLYAKLENNNVTTPETTFYCYTETKTELAANREFSGDASTSGTELFEFPIWGTKHGTIATPGKQMIIPMLSLKKGQKAEPKL